MDVETLYCHHETTRFSRGGDKGDSYMHYVYHPPPFPPQENLLVSWWNIMIIPCLFV